MTITLDAGWISDASMDAYSVSISGGTITPTRYARYLTIIETRLKKDNLLDASGNIKSGSEYLAALLICDLIQSGPITDLGIKSEDFGGAYSYTKSESAAASTKSAFLQKYESALATNNKGSYASSGVVRRDYEIEFSKLSQGVPPRIKDSSDNYPTV
jgi:hypothetical protein